MSKRFSNGQNAARMREQISSQHNHTMDIVGECNVCNARSVCVCQRCGDFYCSPECQRRDWQKHRYICFRMPQLILHKNFLTSPDTNNILGAQMPEITKSSNSFQIENLNSKANNIGNSNNKNYKSNNVQEPRYRIAISPVPRNNSRVLLTGFRSPNRCFVRALTPDDDTAYLLVIKKVDNFGKNGVALKKLPKPQSYAITQRDSVMCRVQILAVRNANAIRVLFIDYGSTGIRNLGELHEISEELVNLQQHAVMVQLRNVDNYNMNDKLLQFLTQHEDHEFKIKYGAEDERGGTAELYNWQTDQLLNDEIIKFGGDMNVYVDGAAVRSKNDKRNSDDDSITGNKNTTPPKAEPKNAVNYKASSSSPKTTANQIEEKPQVSSVVAHPFKTITLQEGLCNVEVMVLDTSCLELGYIGCIAKTDVSYLARVQEYLDHLDLNEQSPYKPILNEYCLAKFEGEWFRAKVIEIPDPNCYTVVYCDYTNVNTLTNADIRAYPRELTTECHTNLCLIEGLPPTLNAALVKFLQNEIKMQTKIIINKIKGVLQVDQDIVLIEMPSLIDKMKNQGLL